MDDAFSLWLSLPFSLSLSGSVALSFTLSLSLALWLSLSLTLSLSLYLSVRLSLSLSLSPPPPSPPHITSGYKQCMWVLCYWKTIFPYLLYINGAVSGRKKYHNKPHFVCVTKFRFLLQCMEPGCDWAFATSYKLKRHQECHGGKKDFVVSCDFITLHLTGPVIKRS